MRALLRLAAAMVLALAVSVGNPAAAHGESEPVIGGWPLAGRPPVLRAFDPPAEQWGRGHRGVDLAAVVGDRVLAAAPGRVTYAARLAGRGVVVVDHGDVRTTYEPVRASVSVGATVSAGTVIGELEAGSHCGTRSCLHWGLIQRETYRDPLSVVTGEGSVRLLPAAARATAVQRATQRVAAARMAAAAGGIGAAAPFDGTVGRNGLLRPVPGPITSPYGRRFHPVLHVWKLHDGTDFGAACGTPIRAAADGRVTSRYFNGGYGNRLMIDHGTLSGQGFVTGYNHATGYTVGVGQTVRRGQVVGYVGSTGYSTGCHLHLMAWVNGGVTDPMRWF